MDYTFNTHGRKVKVTIPEKIDHRFIRSVASDYGHNNISDADVERAHKFASDASPSDYFYRLKEFFNN